MVEVNSRDIKLRIQAKLEVLKTISDFITGQINELEKTLADIESRAASPQASRQVGEARATPRQVDYALDLAARTGFQTTRSELEKMSRIEISKLIDKLKEREKSR